MNRMSTLRFLIAIWNPVYRWFFPPIC